jgi:hypothetical protein
MTGDTNDSPCETRCALTIWKGGTSMSTQNYKNHARWDPKFHFVVVPLALLCFVASIVHLFQEHSRANILLVPVTFVLLVTPILARNYALRVQDRVIRLEEQTRLRSLGVDPTSLTMRQFVALRFAPDEEAGALATRAKAERLSSKQIKEAIVSWQPDAERI